LATTKETSSEFIWNIVGLLAAFALILYMASVFFEFDIGRFIPVSGGNAAQIEDPTALPTVAAAAPTASDMPAYTETPSLTPFDTEIPVGLQIITPTLTATLIPTEEPFPLVMPRYGLEGQFTLHQLQPGESYTFLADLYETAAVVLEALNYNKQGKKLWVGQYMVVIPGLMSVRTDLPTFTVLQITEEIRLQELAKEYSVSVDELRFYNALDSGVNSVMMQVLLVPVSVEGETGN